MIASRDNPPETGEDALHTASSPVSPIQGMISAIHAASCDTMMTMDRKTSTDTMHETTGQGQKDDWDEVILGGDDRVRHGPRTATILAATFIVIVTVALIAAIIIGGGKVRTMMEERNRPKEDREVSMSKEYTDSSGAANPAAGASYAKTSSSTSIAIDHKRIVMDSGAAITTVDLPALTADIGPQPCVLKDKAASCYLGQSKQGDKTIDLYAFRDAASSSLLMTTEKPVRNNVPGAVLAYRQKMAVGEQKDMYGYIIINRDQTGVMLIGQGLGDDIGRGSKVTVQDTDKDKGKDGRKNVQ